MIKLQSIQKNNTISKNINDDAIKKDSTFTTPVNTSTLIIDVEKGPFSAVCTKMTI